MTLNHKTGHAPRSRKVAKEIGDLQGACIGCPGCDGLCMALLDAMTVPEMILNRSKP